MSMMIPVGSLHFRISNIFARGFLNQASDTMRSKDGVKVSHSFHHQLESSTFKLQMFMFSAVLYLLTTLPLSFAKWVRIASRLGQRRTKRLFGTLKSFPPANLVPFTFYQIPLQTNFVKNQASIQGTVYEPYFIEDLYGVYTCLSCTSATYSSHALSYQVHPDMITPGRVAINCTTQAMQSK